MSLAMPQLLMLGAQTPHAAVQSREHAGVDWIPMPLGGIGLETGCVLLLGLNRRLHRILREIQQKRLRTIALEDLQRLLPQAVPERVASHTPVGSGIHRAMLPSVRMEVVSWSTPLAASDLAFEPVALRCILQHDVRLERRQAGSAWPDPSGCQARVCHNE